MRGKALPLLLALAFSLGLAWPQPGRLAGGLALPLWPLGGWITAAIFLVSGWHFDARTQRGRPWLRSLMAGGALNLLGAPLLAALLHAAGLDGGDPGLALGLALMASVPTTLNTGISIAIAGDGEIGLAVLLTVGLSLASLLSLPPILPRLVPAAAGLGLRAGPLFLQLLSQVLLPLLLGQWLRRRRRPPAGLLWLPPLGVAAAVWLAVSRHQGALPGGAWLLRALAAFAALRGLLHLAALGLAARLRLDRPARRSFVVVSSEKSLVLASALLSQLPPALDGRVAGAALFCVLYHLGQAFWDSALAPRV